MKTTDKSFKEKFEKLKHEDGVLFIGGEDSEVCLVSHMTEKHGRVVNVFQSKALIPVEYNDLSNAVRKTFINDIVLADVNYVFFKDFEICFKNLCELDYVEEEED